MTGAVFANDVRALLVELAGEFGDGAFTVTLKRPATQPENPWDDPASDPTEYTINAIVEEYRQDQVDGTLIRAGDKKVLLDPTSVQPTTADRIVLADGEYAVLDVKTESPSGVALLHTLQCRR